MKKRAAKYLSGTTIAQRSFCEKQMMLDKQFGQLETDIQKQRRERGDEEHLRHHLEAIRYGRTRDSRCFVASEIYGSSAPETNALRQFRDTRLLTNLPGRMLIRIYYEISPSIVRLVVKYPVLRRVLKPVIDWIVKKVNK